MSHGENEVELQQTCTELYSHSLHSHADNTNDFSICDVKRDGIRCMKVA